MHMTKDRSVTDTRHRSASILLQVSLTRAVENLLQSANASYIVSNCGSHVDVGTVTC